MNASVGLYFIASVFLACKSGSVGRDGSVASNTASSVYQTHADIEEILLQTTFFEALGRSSPYHNPSDRFLQVFALSQSAPLSLQRPQGQEWGFDFSCPQEGGTLLY